MSDPWLPDGATPVENQPRKVRFGKNKDGFKKGNTLGLVSGARSKVVVMERAELVKAELLENCPWVIEADTVAIETFCKVKARYDLLQEHVMAISEEAGVDAVKPYLWGEVSRAEGNLMKSTENLGLDPTGRARLLKDMGMANHFGTGPKPMEQLAARGRELRTGKSE